MAAVAAAKTKLLDLPFTKLENLRVFCLLMDLSVRRKTSGNFVSAGAKIFYLSSTKRTGCLNCYQIHDMGDSSSALMKLRPVTFLYKPEYDKGPRSLQYGLIAEEVAEIYPDLVAYDPDGKPYTVKVSIPDHDAAQRGSEAVPTEPRPRRRSSRIKKIRSRLSSGR